MTQTQDIHWADAKDLSPEDWEEIGLDLAEQERCRELAENPELEDYYVARARLSRERPSPDEFFGGDAE